MPARKSFLTSGPGRRVAGLWLLLGVASGGGSGAWGHDYWLEPESPWVAQGGTTALHLRMGDRLKTEEERPLQRDHILHFDLFGDQAGRKDLLAAGRDGQMPVARVRQENASTLVVMDRPPRPITMEADKFNAYLTEEGLETALAQRTQQGQADQPGWEIYSRYLKTLIQERDPAAATPNTLYKRRVGQRLEILLENDPRRLKPDGSLTVKVLFDGRPLAGTKVSACRRAGADDQPPFVLPATTNNKGLAEFKLDQPGFWLVRLVYMRPSATIPERRADAVPPQWESFWASYSFGVRTTAPAAPAAASPGPAARAPENAGREHDPKDP